MQGAASPRFDSDDAEGELWDQYGCAVPADYFQTSNAGKHLSDIERLRLHQAAGYQLSAVASDLSADLQ